MKVRVSERELHLNTVEVLRRVEAGEPLTVTVNGRPVADLVPRSAIGVRSPRGRRTVVSIGGDPELRDQPSDAVDVDTGEVFTRAGAVWKRYE